MIPSIVSKCTGACQSVSCALTARTYQSISAVAELTCMTAA